MKWPLDMCLQSPEREELSEPLQHLPVKLVQRYMFIYNTEHV